MEQCKVKILWIDDDLFRLKLQPYIDEFEDNGFDIIKVANPDDIDEMIDQHSDIQCIIVDISMPTGESINVNEAKKGMRTGLLVLQKLNKNVKIDHIKKVVFTVVEDEQVRRYCDSCNVSYLKKQDNVTDVFIDKIKRLIENGS
ncbi:MAG: response regulator [Prevotellaceae bacterium]|jgi:CheY-like chemotaxis protein|nr:response regulator [Prevotellaceae bacterium]